MKSLTKNSSNKFPWSYFIAKPTFVWTDLIIQLCFIEYLVRNKGERFMCKSTQTEVNLQNKWPLGLETKESILLYFY